MHRSNIFRNFVADLTSYVTTHLKSNRMATKHSEYYFTNWDRYNDAKDAIYAHNPSAYSKLEWEGKYGDNYYVALYDDLTTDEIESVARYIREFDGHFYA